jgi:hypothetical protein
MKRQRRRSSSQCRHGRLSRATCWRRDIIVAMCERAQGSDDGVATREVRSWLRGYLGDRSVGRTPAQKAPRDQNVSGHTNWRARMMSSVLRLRAAAPRSQAMSCLSPLYVSQRPDRQRVSAPWRFEASGWPRRRLPAHGGLLSLLFLLTSFAFGENATSVYRL